MSAAKQLNTLALVEILRDMNATFDVRNEMFVSIAREHKAKYDALILANFTPEQAMQIITTRSF